MTSQGAMTAASIVSMDCCNIQRCPSWLINVADDVADNIADNGADGSYECMEVDKYPLENLWVTDLEVIGCKVDNGDSPEAYKTMRNNIDILKSLGARTNGNLPFERVSGFPRRSDEYTLQNPHELVPCHRDDIQVLFWGSPHCCPSRWTPDSKSHGNGDKLSFKTNAFEAMAYLCPRGLVIMITTVNYRVAYYRRTFRTLHVGPVKFISHKSMKSGSIEQVHPEGGEIASVIIPNDKTWLLSNNLDPDGVLDFGGLVANYMALCPGPVIELGCNTASLSMEVAMSIDDGI